MTIDWKEQWALHAPTFKNGVAIVSFGPHQFCLEPGPGFGDLSHPTTRIMLALMPYQIECPAIDIGCGSGVLSLAAAFAGAPKVYGIDCDPLALEHAKKNAKLSRKTIHFAAALKESPQKCLVLMNMISSEQAVAWNHHRHLHSAVNQMIVSGIPEKEKERFLSQVDYGNLIEERSLEGWVGFVFKP